MNFDYNPEQLAFQDHVKTVLQTRLKPEFKEWKAEKTTPRRMWEILGEGSPSGLPTEV